MRQSLALLVVGALLGATAMFGTATQAQAPAMMAYNGVVKPIGPYTPGVGVGDTVYLLGFGHVVKATIFMTDLAEFAVVNEIYGSYFPAGGVPPVRSTVQVAARPRGARIEIDFVAVR